MIPKTGSGIAPPPVALPSAGLGRLRKVALIGTAPTIEFAPWYDPTYEIWSHAICATRCKRVDRLFELHPEVTWREPKTKRPYLDMLQRTRTPIFMLDRHHDIPSSVRYPRERAFGMCRTLTGGRVHFGSQADFMIALALSEGVTHIGLFGIHYIDPVKDGDRLEQLIAFKFWLGVAAGMGVHLEIPDGNPVFDLPSEIYGYESHSTSEKYGARLKREQAVERQRTAHSQPTRQALTPSDGKTLRPLPPEVRGVLGGAPMPENWDRFEEVTA